MSSSRKFSKILLAVAVLLFAGLAAEGVARGWLALGGEGYDRGQALQRLAGLRDAALGQRPGAEAESARAVEADHDVPWSVHPYLGFDLERTPGQIDKNLAKQATESAEEPFDILLVGGSVAADFGWLGKPRLFELLAADPRLAGRQLRLLNYARPAYKQPQQLIAVSYLLGLGLLPDAVINIDGFNEVAVAGANASRGMHPANPADSQWLPLLSSSAGDSRTIELAAAVFEERGKLLEEIAAAEESIFLRSALLSRLSFARVERRQAGYASAVERLTEYLSESSGGSGRRGPSFPPNADGVLEICVRVWSESSRSLEAVCASRGIPYVQILQPTLHDEGSKPLSAREVETGQAAEVWKVAARLGYPLLREAGAELRVAGVGFHDASGIFQEVEEDLYHDPCHFGEEGNRRLAEAVAPALLEEL